MLRLCKSIVLERAFHCSLSIRWFILFRRWAALCRFACVSITPLRVAALVGLAFSLSVFIAFSFYCCFLQHGKEITANTTAEAADFILGEEEAPRAQLHYKVPQQKERQRIKRALRCTRDNQTRETGRSTCSHNAADSQPQHSASLRGRGSRRAPRTRINTGRCLFMARFCFRLTPPYLIAHAFPFLTSRTVWGWSQSHARRTRCYAGNRRHGSARSHAGRQLGWDSFYTAANSHSAIGGRRSSGTHGIGSSLHGWNDRKG